MKIYQGESCDITLKLTDDQGDVPDLDNKDLTVFLTRRGEITPGIKASTRTRVGYLPLVNVGGGVFMMRLGSGQTALLEGEYSIEIKLNENETCQIAKCESVTFMSSKIGKLQ